MNDQNCEDSTYLEIPAQNNFENGPTNALTVNTKKLIDAATKVSVKDCLRRRYRTYIDGGLRVELEMHNLEEQIIICRQMLATNEGNVTELQEYIIVASRVYTRHLTKMLTLSHINAKNKKPPVLPITFSVKETSELYWTLVEFGSIESVVAQIEHGLKKNKARLLERMAHAQPEGRDVVLKSIEVIEAALRQWRPTAEAVVHGRCIVMQNMISAEIMGMGQGTGVVEMQEDRSCIGAEEVLCPSDS